MQANQPDWHELVSEAAGTKDPDKRARVARKLEIAARAEQQQVKQKLAKRVQTYKEILRAKNKAK